MCGKVVAEVWWIGGRDGLVRNGETLGKRRQVEKNIILFLEFWRCRLSKLWTDFVSRETVGDCTKDIESVETRQGQHFKLSTCSLWSRWNAFDLFITLTSIIDVVMTFTMDAGNVGALGVARVLRIVRVAKIIRCLEQQPHLKSG